MKNLALRLTLLGLFVAAAGVAAYFAWMSSSRTRQDARALAAFDTSAVCDERDILELRGAQQGYVAAGQGDQFWASKVDGSIAEDSRDAEHTARPVHGSAGQAAIDSASSALQDFEQMDRRARDYARSGQKLLASDLIFSNGYELTTAAASAVEDARLAERLPYESTPAALERQQLTAAGAAAAVGLLVMLSAVAGGRTARGCSRAMPRARSRDSKARGRRPTPDAVRLKRGWSAARVVAEGAQTAHARHSLGELEPDGPGTATPAGSGHQGGAGVGSPPPPAVAAAAAAPADRSARRRLALLRSCPGAWTPRRCPPSSRAPRLCSMHPVSCCGSPIPTGRS